jgi:hypothetical protein
MMTKMQSDTCMPTESTEAIQASDEHSYTLKIMPAQKGRDLMDVRVSDRLGSQTEGRADKEA